MGSIESAMPENIEKRSFSKIWQLQREKEELAIQNLAKMTCSDKNVLAFVCGQFWWIDLELVSIESSMLKPPEKRNFSQNEQ